MIGGVGDRRRAEGDAASRRRYSCSAPPRAEAHGPDRPRNRFPPVESRVNVLQAPCCADLPLEKPSVSLTAPEWIERGGHMRVPRKLLGAAVALAVSASTVGLVAVAGATTRPTSTSIKGVSVYGAASPEVVKANSDSKVVLTVTVLKNGKADAGIAVTLNMSDLQYEANHGDCSLTFYKSLDQRYPSGKVGKTNTKGQLKLGNYGAEGVSPGSFCVLYGGILGASGVSIVPKGTATVLHHATKGEDFYLVVCQTNPADDPYVITQSAAHLTVTTGGPHDPFSLVVKKTTGGSPVDNDNTIFYLEVHSTYQSCGNPNPTAPPGADTNSGGDATIDYLPSTTAGTCKVTAQEADTGSTSNVVKITQNS